MKNKTKQITAIVAGATAAAATAIGAYWLYGSKDAAKHRQKASSWMLKARADVMDAVEKLKTIDKEAYFQIVDNVIKKYAENSGKAEDLASISKELRAAWTHIHATISPAKKTAKKKTK